MKRALFVLAGSSILAVASTVGVSTQTPAPAAATAPTFHKDVAPILYEQLRELPSAGRDWPDVVPHLRDHAAVGALDQGEGRVSARCRPGRPIPHTA